MDGKVGGKYLLCVWGGVRISLPFREHRLDFVNERLKTWANRTAPATRGGRGGRSSPRRRGPAPILVLGVCVCVFFF